MKIEEILVIGVYGICGIPGIGSNTYFQTSKSTLKRTMLVRFASLKNVLRSQFCPSSDGRIIQRLCLATSKVNNGINQLVIEGYIFREIEEYWNIRTH